MTRAVPEDIRLIRRHVSDDEFREALDGAPVRQHPEVGRKNASPSEEKQMT
jgi:hypothetical protein